MKLQNSIIFKIKIKYTLWTIFLKCNKVLQLKFVIVNKVEAWIFKNQLSKMYRDALLMHKINDNHVEKYEQIDFETNCLLNLKNFRFEFSFWNSFCFAKISYIKTYNIDQFNFNWQTIETDYPILNATIFA